MAANDLLEQGTGSKRSSGDGPYINLNVKLFLTDLGETEVKNSQRLRSMQDVAGNPGVGIEGNRVYAATLKNFIISSKINQIELQRVELVSKKHEITDLTKLIVYALLYRLYPQNLCQQLEGKGFLSRPLDAAEQRVLTDMHGAELDAWRERFAAQLEPLAAEDGLSTEKDPALRRKEILSVAGKLAAMAPLEFFRALLERRDDRDALIASAVDLVRRYLRRTRISDYLSSAFLEWIENAEKVNLQHAFILWRDAYRAEHGTEYPAKSVDQLLRDDRKHKDVLTALAEKNQIALKINWKFGKTRLRHGLHVEDVAVVKIRLINKGLIGGWVRETIAARLNADVKGKNLGEFYDHAQDEQRLGAGLGLIFTSFLKEECVRQHIDVFVSTREDTKRAETVMTLTMKINPFTA